MEDVTRDAADAAWSAALLGWAMRAADAIAAAEGDARDRSFELARPGRPIAVPGTGRIPRPAAQPASPVPLGTARPGLAVPLDGSAA